MGLLVELCGCPRAWLSEYFFFSPDTNFHVQLVNLKFKVILGPRCHFARRLKWNFWCYYGSQPSSQQYSRRAEKCYGKGSRLVASRKPTSIGRIGRYTTTTPTHSALHSVLADAVSCYYNLAPSRATSQQPFRTTANTSRSRLSLAALAFLTGAFNTLHVFAYMGIVAGKLRSACIN